MKKKSKQKVITAHDVMLYNSLCDVNHRGNKCKKMNWWIPTQNTLKSE